MIARFFRWLFGFGGKQPSHNSWGGLYEAKVLHVIDGDTVDVDQAGRKIRIRLSSIDCPEDGQPGEDAATRGLIRLVGGRCVYLETHGHDKYDRTIATIFVMDGAELINVNERMVMLGHAWVLRAFYDHLSKRRQRQLNHLERWAKSKRVGLWKSDNPIPPWEWRKEFQRKAR